jgi:uncharacterized RDD family membrane protein YckC
MIDSLLSLTPFFITLPLVAMLLSADNANDQLVGRSLLLLGLLPSIFFYFVVGVIQTSRGKFTLGQRIMKIKLVKKNNQPTELINGLLYFGSWIVFLAVIVFYNLLPLILIIYFWSLIDSQQRNIFNLISQTKFVAQTKEDQQPTVNNKRKVDMLQKLQQLK